MSRVLSIFQIPQRRKCLWKTDYLELIHKLIGNHWENTDQSSGSLFPTFSTSGWSTESFLAFIQSSSSPSDNVSIIWKFSKINNADPSSYKLNVIHTTHTHEWTHTQTYTQFMITEAKNYNIVLFFISKLLNHFSAFLGSLRRIPIPRGCIFCFQFPFYPPQYHIVLDIIETQNMFNEWIYMWMTQNIRQLLKAFKLALERVYFKCIQFTFKSNTNDLVTVKE